MTQREKHAAMMDRIAKHGRFLIDAYGLREDTDPIRLCKRLRQIETKVHRVITDACNGDTDDLTYERALQTAEGSVLRLMGFLPHGFMINTDPRGYALKIDSNEFVPQGMYRDMGGYGILAPDLTEPW